MGIAKERNSIKTRLFLYLFMAILSLALVAALFPVIGRALFHMPNPSSSFDCDDATLVMYQHLERLGISTTPILGNLKMTGEEYLETDHVWLLVQFGRWNVAFDWGVPRITRQHYEGYSLTYDQLVYFVNQDRIGKAPGILPSVADRPSDIFFRP